MRDTPCNFNSRYPDWRAGDEIFVLYSKQENWEQLYSFVRTASIATAWPDEILRNLEMTFSILFIQTHLMLTESQEQLISSSQKAIRCFWKLGISVFWTYIIYSLLNIQISGRTKVNIWKMLIVCSIFEPKWFKMPKIHRGFANRHIKIYKKSPVAASLIKGIFWIIFGRGRRKKWTYAKFAKKHCSEYNTIMYK